MYFGGDKYSKQIMRGAGFEIKFYCDNFNPTLNIKCHYTCLDALDRHNMIV